MADPVVRMRAITKRFDGLPVLDAVDFELHPGEVHALAGGNGAGKSTLMKILRGVYQADEGTIEIDGQAVQLTSSQDAMGRGIAMIFQEFSVIPTLTVAQNVFLNHEPTGTYGLIDDGASVERTRELFARMGVTIDPTRRLEDLGTAYWQLTEIAKALAQDARVLIMDEPTASLAKDEADHLFAQIRSLTEHGIAIVYITHRIEEIFAVTDRVTVLRDGRVVGTSETASLTGEQLVELIVGRRMESVLAWQARAVRRDIEPLLEVRNLHVKPRLRGVSFDLYPGEILGLAGLMGSGRSEIARALFGIDRITAGEFRIRGRVANIRSPRDAIAAGISLVPEDRRLQGLVLDHSVRSNLLLPLLDRLATRGWMDDAGGTRMARDLVAQLSIKVSSIERPVSQLSGGNQQKVVLAKWMGTEPQIYVMDEPTAGVDIGTKVEIVGMVRQLADAGKAVIFISSEFSELLAVCDRIVVLRGGTVASSFEREAVPDEETLHLAVQGIGKVVAHA
jgi:ribose transport system ATP-binding protein